MYTSFFGFRAKPFNNKPELRFHYITPAYAENFNTIRRDIREHQEVLVLTGEAGIGKTLFLQRLVTASQNQDVHFISCPYSTLTFAELIDYVCEELGLTIEHMSLPEKIQWLQASLMENLKQGKTIVLVIDDAHNISDETLGELLSFSSAQKNDDRFLQIFLIGLSELEEKLHAVMSAPSAHKVAYYRLWPLENDEVPKFIAQQLRAAGYQGNTIFTPSAVDRIAEYTKGSLRALSLLCDASLVIAYLQSSRQVTADIVDEAAQQHCLVPQDQAAASITSDEPKSSTSHTSSPETTQTPLSSTARKGSGKSSKAVSAVDSNIAPTSGDSLSQKSHVKDKKSVSSSLRRNLPVAAGLAALLLYGAVTAMRFYSSDQSDIKPLIAYAKAPEEIIPVKPSTEDLKPLQNATDNDSIPPLDPKVQALLVLAERQVDEQKMFAPAGDNALETYEEILNLEPDNEAAQAGLAILNQYSLQPVLEDEPERQNQYDEQVQYAKQILKEFDEQFAIAKQEKEAYLKDLSNYYIGQAIMANQQKLRYRIETVLIANQQPDDGEGNIVAMLEREGVPPREPNHLIPRSTLDPGDRVMRFLNKAKRLMKVKKLTTPGDNALNNFRQVLELAPGNAEALAGIQTIMDLTLSQANGELESGNVAYAKKILRLAIGIDPDNAELIKKSRGIAREIERQELALIPAPPELEAEVISLTDPELVASMLQKAMEGNAREVAKLLAAGVHPDVRDGYQDTALMLAAKNGHLDVVKALLNRGAKIDLTNILGETALIYAVHHNRPDIISLLITKRASVHFKTKGEAGGRTALFAAVESGNFAITRLLLDSGAMPNLRDDNGRTPLMLAAGLGYEQILKLLLSKKTNLNTQDKNGRTALMLAARNGHVSVIKILLEKGAEVNAEDRGGKNAFYHAMSGGHLKAAELLRHHATTSADNSQHEIKPFA